MMKSFQITLIATLVCIAVIALCSDMWSVKTLEKRTVANTSIVLDDEFENPRVLDSVYVFVPETETAGTFTNICTIKHALSTNDTGTTVSTSTQTVNAAYIEDMNVKVLKGDVLYVSNTMTRTTVRLFFK